MSSLLDLRSDVKDFLVEFAGPFYDELRNLVFVFVPFLTPGSYFWTCVVTFIVGSAILYAVRRRQTGLSLRGYFQYVFPKEIYLSADAKLNYKFYLFFGVFHVLIPYKMVYSLGGPISEWLAGGLTTLFGPVAPETAGSGLLPMVLYSIAAFVALDLGHYVAHRLAHRFPALWELHKVHHSTSALQPLACFLEHPVESIIQGSCCALLIGLTLGFAEYLAPAATEITLFNTSALVLLFTLTNLFRHSHIWLEYPRWLSYFASSPAMHQIHHSIRHEHYDKNFAVNLALWDWMFGTLHMPNGEEKLQFGLIDEPKEDYTTIAKLFFLPIIKMFGHFKRFLSPAAS